MNSEEQVAENQDEQGEVKTEPNQQEVETEGSEQAEGQESEAKQEGAPEQYEFKAVEGVTIDTETMTAYSEAAKELNLSQEAAQKMFDKMAPVIAQRQVEQFTAKIMGYREILKADKELGGAKYSENMAVAKSAIDKFGSPELLKALETPGIGDNPEFIRLCYRVGKAMSEDKIVSGKAPKAEKSKAQVLYDKTS
ncbi:MAG: hypothetical protein LBE24_04035 [Methylobacillus sp.]|jgi:hypothetical protein|nr:hypothetical protein [Methylobacillus sp.]